MMNQTPYSKATAHGPPGMRSCFFYSMEERSQKCRGMSCSSCVCKWFTSDVHGKCVLEEISECSLPRIHPSNQTCFIYYFSGCRVQQSSSEGQANQRKQTVLQSSLMGGRMFVGKELLTTSSPPLNQYSTRAQTQGTTHTLVFTVQMS